VETPGTDAAGGIDELQPGIDHEINPNPNPKRASSLPLDPTFLQPLRGVGGPSEALMASPSGADGADLNSGILETDPGADGQAVRRLSPPVIRDEDGVGRIVLTLAPSVTDPRRLSTVSRSPS